jgi:hypothetical protein
MKTQIQEDDFLTIGNEDISTSGGDFTPLEDGVYEAACAGIVVKELQNFEKTALEKKIILLFQIATEDGFRYLQSKPMKKSLHEKSNFWKLLQKWTKQKDPETLIKKMGTDGKFDITFFIGKPIQISVESEEVGDKTYNRIDAYISPKKGAKGITADANVPSFMVKDAFTVKLAAGISVQESKKDATPAPAPAPAEVDDDDDEADLPF